MATVVASSMTVRLGCSRTLWISGSRRVCVSVVGCPGTRGPATVSPCSPRSSVAHLSKARAYGRAEVDGEEDSRGAGPRLNLQINAIRANSVSKNSEAAMVPKVASPPCVRQSEPRVSLSPFCRCAQPIGNELNHGSIQSSDYTSHSNRFPPAPLARLPQ
jgi:hypothetical protein